MKRKWGGGALGKVPFKGLLWNSISRYICKQVVPKVLYSAIRNNKENKYGKYIYTVHGHFTQQIYCVTFQCHWAPFKISLSLYL